MERQTFAGNWSDMHIVFFCNCASCHLCADLFSRSGRRVLFCGCIQPCISYRCFWNENLRTWVSVFREQYFYCGSDDGIRKGIFLRFDHFFAFLCPVASVPDRAAAEIRSRRHMACCSCGRSSDATRFYMVSAPDSTVEKRAVAYHNCSCYWWYKNAF